MFLESADSHGVLALAADQEPKFWKVLEYLYLHYYIGTNLELRYPPRLVCL